MRMDAAFPSQYLKAADLQGRTVKVTMDRVAMEEVGSDHKPVLYFVGKERGLVLNKTNTNNIIDAYGVESEAWAGQPIELFPTMVDFQGRSVEAIRIRAPRPAPVQHRAAPVSHPHNGAANYASGHQARHAPDQGQAVAAAPRGDLDDEIPF